MTQSHAIDLVTAAEDGQLWGLWYTTVPTADEITAYIDTALTGQRDRTMLPWVVRELSTGQIVGSTRFHDIVPEIDRVEIGYTWFAKRWQRTHVNTACKLLQLSHAFDSLGCAVVGFRTDILNTDSQNAIEKLGAHRDGVIRHFQARRNGQPRDTMMYSILHSEWPRVRRILELRLRPPPPPDVGVR